MTDTMIESLVRDSAAPLAAVELPSGRFLAVNPACAKLLGSTVDDLTGSSSLEQLTPAERPSAELGFQALADGSLTGYQAIRTRATPEDPGQSFSVWVNAVEVGDRRVGLISVAPATGRAGEFRTIEPRPVARELGDVVLGTVDGAWRIDRISHDVSALLGITPDQCVGVPVLGAIHPSDAPGFLAAVEHARRGERSVALAVRLSARSPQWREVSAVFAVISPEVPPPMAFALIPSEPPAGSAAGSNPVPTPTPTPAASRGWRRTGSGSRMSCTRPDSFPRSGSCPLFPATPGSACSPVGSGRFSPACSTASGPPRSPRTSSSARARSAITCLPSTPSCRSTAR